MLCTIPLYVMLLCGARTCLCSDDEDNDNNKCLAKEMRKRQEKRQVTMFQTGRLHSNFRNLNLTCNLHTKTDQKFKSDFKLNISRSEMA